MNFQLNQDVSENQTFDIQVLNDQMSRATHRVINAIDSLNSLNDNFRITVRFLLQSFLTTHESIVIILRHKNEEKYDKSEGKTNVLFGADAMSLVREQVEKVFTITLLCQDPDNWSKIYIKDDWKRIYEGFLLRRDETKKLPRFQEYTQQIAPDILENIRKHIGITDEEKEAIEFKYYNYGQPLPPHLKRSEVMLFPTPGQVNKLLENTDCKDFLERLHREYKFISGYNHAGLLKLQLLVMSDRKFSEHFDESKKEIYYQKQILLPAIITSYTAHIAACTEILRFIPHDVEILVALIKQWELLKKGSLLAVSLWDMRARNLFPKDVTI
jgi:hypothetical protein